MENLFQAHTNSPLTHAHAHRRAREHSHFYTHTATQTDSHWLTDPEKKTGEFSKNKKKGKTGRYAIEFSEWKNSNPR